MKVQHMAVASVLSVAMLPSLSHAQTKLSPFAPLTLANQAASKGDFTVATSKSAATIYRDEADFPVVRLAAEAFAGDVASITGATPQVSTSPATAAPTAIFVGTLGKSKLIDDLVAKKKIDVRSLRGSWENFVITTVDNPAPGVKQGLVIIGSDRRGTAFGIFSLSESIGVSPWVWWADVAPAKRETVVLSNANFRSKTPSVKYRGIFLNDEDWALQPWASKTFETDTKDIGPKTYAKVCELLLRLKANYLWPAMHHVTKAFNIYPQNKIVADEYAIVMGASHAEPMLRNNVTEWDRKVRGEFNYGTNRTEVLKYWDERVKINAPFENVYTMGMRGMHDDPMEGNGSVQDNVKLMEDIFAEQRKMLAKYVNSDLTKVPQIFVPYKEVLILYQNGLKVPDDITLVWVDDNFGYIRQLSNPTEQKRKGGAGVYYHFSYLGPPHEYLWLGSTSPALTAYEMGKAYAMGAKDVWVFNVGDIKPIEKEMEFGLRMAYDVDRYPVDKAMNFLFDWSNATFGPMHAKEIAAILDQFYRLTGELKPEHVGRVAVSKAHRQERLAMYADITKRAEALYAQLPQRQRDAFFELVLYPVKGANLIEQKRAYITWGDSNKALEAYNEIQAITATYNNDIKGGKWNRMMSANPQNLSVFAKPNPQAIAGSPQPGTPILELHPKEATLTGGMKKVGDDLVGTIPEQLTEGNGNIAKFNVKVDTDQPVSLYFLASCPDNKRDSWYVKLNSKKVTINDQLTGKSYEWLKIMDVDLKAGQNELTIEQREPGAAIRRIAVMKANTTPSQGAATPFVTLNATQFTASKNSRASQWKKLDGLGLTGSAMTVLPFQTASIPDADAAKAPSLTFSFKGNLTDCTVEPMFLPTHRAHSQAGLRYAVSVDGGPAQIRDIETLEFSGQWGLNVLKSYASETTQHKLKAGSDHTVTVSLLDPGMVLSQVRLFAPESDN